MDRLARACAIALACFAACAPPHGEAPRAEPPAARDLSIAPERAEVWGWEVDVGGAGDRPGAPLVACRLEPSGAPAIVADDGRRWSARARLAPGVTTIAATCVDARGARHASATATFVARLRDGPTARARAALSGGDLLLDGSASAPSDGAPAAITDYAWTQDPSGIAIGRGARVRRAIADLPAGDVVLRLRVRDARGREDASAVKIAVRDGRRAIVDARGDAGPDAADAVIYGVVPRLFGAPPLRAVTRHLADLADLGATALWLSPIFDTPPEQYGYAVTDYLRVRADYGTEEDLAALVEEAHRRGLRVLLDLVPNHTSAEHRYFVDAAARGEASHYFGFYQRDAEGEPVHYFDWTHLPNLSYDAEVTRWMLAVSEHWIARFGVDGYRVDAAWGVTRRAPAFWDAWRADVRRLAPDALLVAEASARDPFYAAHGFDAAYDWTDELGKAAWEHAFDDLDAAPSRVDAAVRATRSRPLTFLENNDTGARFVTRHGAGLTRVAAAALLTLPGIPALFTGQERGAEYEPYARLAPLDDRDPHALRPWYRSLIAVRRATRALRGAGYERLAAEPSSRVLAYARRGEGGDVAIVVLRFDGRPARVRIALPADRADGSPTAWRDRVSGRTFGAAGSALRVDVDGWSARVLVPEP